MSKDYKQREAYKYLHGDLDKVSPNIERGWNRHNFDIGPVRRKRKDVKEKDIDIVINEEVDEYRHLLS